jgi:glucose/mannose transport system substrate-binding protein
VPSGSAEAAIGCGPAVTEFGFAARHPDVDVRDRSYENHGMAVKGRILRGDPPQLFAEWPDQSLRPYQEAGAIRDLTEVWTDNEWEEAFLHGPVERSTIDGRRYAVPLNIHRMNNLFYNVGVVEEAGVDPESLESPSDLLDAMETIASETDAAPMAQQTQAVWSTLQLWEDVLIGVSDVSTYNDVLENGVSANEDAVRQALQTVSDYEEHFNEDSGSIAWDQANGKVIEGEAAFIHQGDWAAGQYKATEGFEFEGDWNYVPFPGTGGVYHVVADSFVKPTPNPSSDATDAWLSYCGSVDGQERFNPIKGSIPPRTDVPDDEFGPFLTAQRGDFEESDSQPPTIAHGTGVTPQVKSNVEGAFSSFIGNWNVDDTYNQLSNAF